MAIDHPACRRHHRVRGERQHHFGEILSFDEQQPTPVVSPHREARPILIDAHRGPRPRERHDVEMAHLAGQGTVRHPSAIR